MENIFCYNDFPRIKVYLVMKMNTLVNIVKSYVIYWNINELNKFYLYKTPEKLNKLLST